MALTIGSLFAGIGGLELGLERAGLGPVVWQVEKEEFPRKVLAKHWPDAESFDDVKEVGAHNLAPVDLICGGFPCQDISHAGAGAGLAGERSGLWYEYARIVRELRPRWVVIENVSALLSRGLDAVLGTLAALGYDALWDCIPAAAVGAPHRRDRVFIVAWLADAERERMEGPDAHAFANEPAFSGALRDCRARWELADAQRSGRHGRTGQGEESARRRQSANERGELADADSKRRSGEGLNRASRPGTEWDESDGGREGALVDANGGRSQSERQRSLLDGDRASLGNGANGCNLPKWPPPPGDVHAWGRVPAYFKPAFCRLADGLPDGLARNRRHALKGYGNAVVPAVAEVIGRFIVEAERDAA